MISHMKNPNGRVRLGIFLLATMALAAPVFGQTSTVANSTWNGGTGPWTSSLNWATNGTLAVTTPSCRNQ
jgi:hypothetical protein